MTDPVRKYALDKIQQKDFNCAFCCGVVTC